MNEIYVSPSAHRILLEMSKTNSFGGVSWLNIPFSGTPTKGAATLILNKNTAGEQPVKTVLRPQTKNEATAYLMPVVGNAKLKKGNSDEMLFAPLIPGEDTTVTFFNGTNSPRDLAIKNLSLTHDGIMSLNLKKKKGGPNFVDICVESIELGASAGNLSAGICLPFPHASLTVFFGVVKQGFALSKSGLGSISVLVQSTAAFPGDGLRWEGVGGCTVETYGYFSLLLFESTNKFIEVFCPVKFIEGNLSVKIDAAKPSLEIRDIPQPVIDTLNEAIPGSGQSFVEIISALQQFQSNPSNQNFLDFHYKLTYLNYN
jgi:hypothetical protein